MASWTASKDGEPRMDLLIRHRLDVEDLAKALSWVCQHYSDTALEDMSSAQVRNHVRFVLRCYGSDALMDSEPGDEHRAAVRKAFDAPRAIEHDDHGGEH